MVSMPSNIFGKTGTSVSVLFIDKEGADTRKGAILIDASKLGEDKKVEGKKRHVLSDADEQLIIDTFKKHESTDELAALAIYDDMADKDFSFSAKQYFDVKLNYVEITEEEYHARIADFSQRYADMRKKGSALDDTIESIVKKIQYR